jgi:hypothetical protein
MVTSRYIHASWSRDAAQNRRPLSRGQAKGGIGFEKLVPEGGKVLKNLSPEGGKVLKKFSEQGPYVLRTDTVHLRLMGVCHGCTNLAWREAAFSGCVESKRSAVAYRTGGAKCERRLSLSLSPRSPSLRFPSPLIEPDVTISVIRLSDGFHMEACAEV